MYIYVSREHYDNEVKVPDITNMTLEDAKKLLSSRNLRLGPQNEVYSDAAPGTVVNQNPKAGEALVIGERFPWKFRRARRPRRSPLPPRHPPQRRTPTPSTTPSASPSAPPEPSPSTPPTQPTEEPDGGD